jgi:DNA-binding MarR family transcriptional regulator
MAIIRRHNPATKFAQISNEALEDARLSYRARGVLAYLLSRPADWRTSAEVLAKQGREGRDAIRAALTELEKVGYLVRVRSQDPETGRWSTDTYVEDFPTDPNE